LDQSSKLRACGELRSMAHIGTSIPRSGVFGSNHVLRYMLVPRKSGVVELERMGRLKLTHHLIFLPRAAVPFLLSQHRSTPNGQSNIGDWCKNTHLYCQGNNVAQARQSLLPPYCCCQLRARIAQIATRPEEGVLLQTVPWTDSKCFRATISQISTLVIFACSWQQVVPHRAVNLGASSPLVHGLGNTHMRHEP
jgi:hypothetical protein